MKIQIEFLEGFEVEQWIQADLENLPLEDVNKVFMLICSWLVTKAALKRTESRGGHLRLDYPNEDDRWEKRQIIQADEG